MCLLRLEKISHFSSPLPLAEIRMPPFIKFSEIFQPLNYQVPQPPNWTQSKRFYLKVAHVFYRAGMMP